MSNTFPPKFPFSVRDPLHRDRELLRRNREYQNAPSQTAVGDTENVMTESGFDMCLAIAQQAINSQMQYAWKAWKRRQNFQDTFRIFKDQEVVNGPIVDSEDGIEATFAPLEVNLAVQDGKLGQVEVKLTMKSGKITYFKKRDLLDYSFQNWSVTFLVDLDKNPCDLAVLRAIEPHAGTIAENTISSKPGLSESVFSIEYLFLKFTEIDLEGLPENHFDYGSDGNNVPSAATAVFKRSLNLLLWGKLAPETDQAGGKFILGTVMRRNTTQVVPTFALTDFLFDVTANWTTPEASTLNYLGVFEGKSLPEDRNDARMKLHHPWMRSTQIDGTEGTIAGVMGFCKQKFIDEYLIRNFSNALGLAPQGNGLKWTYAQTTTEPEQVKEDLIKRMFNLSRSYEVNIEIVPGSNQLQISGKVSSSVRYDGSTWLKQSKKDHTEWNYTEGYIPLSGTLTLAGEGAGSDFSLRGELQYTFGAPVVTKNETGGFQKVTEAISKGYKALGIIGNTPDEILDSAASNMQSRLKQVLESQLAQVQADLTNHQFIPPGTGVFTFQNPRFSKAGDFLFDVIYTAV